MDLTFWPRLSKCCCCFSLRTGSLIIGYASLITTGLALSGVSLSLSRVVTYLRLHHGQPAGGHSPQEMDNMAVSLYVAHAYFLLVLIYYSVISLLLVIGVHRNKSRYLRCYCNAALLLLVLASALVVVTLVFFGLVASLPLLKWCVILFYCLVVVRSACLELEEADRPQVYALKPLQTVGVEAQDTPHHPAAAALV